MTTDICFCERSSRTTSLKRSGTIGRSAIRHFLNLASYSSGSASCTRCPTAQVMTCSGPSRKPSRFFANGPGQDAREVAADGGLLGDDERLAHGGGSVAASGSSSRRRARSTRLPRAPRAARRARPRWGRRSRRAGRRRPWRAKPSPSTRPVASTSGPPELPERTRPRSGRSSGAPARARRRPRSDARASRPTRAGAHVVRARCAGSRARAPRSRRGGLERERAARGARRPGDAQDRDVVASGRRRPRARRSARPGAAHLDARVVLAGDDVRVRHHEPVAPRPSPSPRRRARTRCRAPARRCAAAPRPPGRARSPPAAAARRASGPRCAGNGSKRASALRSGPDGGSTALSARRIAGALDVAAQLSTAGRLQRDRAGDPGQPERRSPRSAARRARRRPRRARGCAQPPPQPRAEALETPAANSTPSDSAPTSPNSGA